MDRIARQVDGMEIAVQSNSMRHVAVAAKKKRVRQNPWPPCHHVSIDCQVVMSVSAKCRTAANLRRWTLEGHSAVALSSTHSVFVSSIRLDSYRIQVQI